MDSKEMVEKVYPEVVIICPHPFCFHVVVPGRWEECIGKGNTQQAAWNDALLRIREEGGPV